MYMYALLYSSTAAAAAAAANGAAFDHQTSQVLLGGRFP